VCGLPELAEQGADASDSRTQDRAALVVAARWELCRSDVVPVVHPMGMDEAPSYMWRGPLTDEEMVELIRSYGGSPGAGWWDRIRPHSLGWVSARLGDGRLVGFVNVAWDGGDHAFLLDTKTRGTHQHRGIGTRLVAMAAGHARDAGCEWLHVDFRDDLAPFYFDGCGFRSTAAGLVHLRGTEDT